MNDLYRKFVYTLYSIIILYIFFLGKSISADQTATIIADEIVSSNKTDIVNAKGDVIILNHDGTKIKADKITYEKLITISLKLNGSLNITVPKKIFYLVI